MGKLVRDRIPEIIRAQGGEASVRVLGEPDYRAALLDKLVEEAEEARNAEPGQLLEELADVFEVLQSICASQGWTTQGIESAANRKAQARGACAHRLYLE